MILIVFGVLSIVLIVLSLFAMLYEFISKKFEFQPILKKYLVHVLVVIFLFALITPLILYLFGLFNKDRALHNSDVLGYYGALIGGVVTVLGVYWTLNYESQKSKEEKRESSLPIFTFSIHSDTANNSNTISPFVIGENLKGKFKEESEKLNKCSKKLIDRRKKVKERLEDFYDYTIKVLAEFNPDDKEKIDDEEKIKEYLEYEREVIKRNENSLDKKIREIINKRKICRLDKSIILNISNIGLQPAILSTIKFIPKGIISSSDESKKRILDYLSVQKGEDTKLKVIFDCYFENQDGLNAEFQEWGDLELKYTDLYSNQYKYNIPIKIKRGTVQEEDKIPIEQFDLIINKSQLPIRPKVN